MANTRRRRIKKTKVNTKKSRYVEEEEETKEEEKTKEEEETKEEETKEEEPKRRRPNRIQRLELIEEPDLSSHSLSTIQSSFIDKEVSMPLTVRRVDDKDIANQHLTDIYKKINIATDDVPQKLSSSNKNDWYTNLNSKLDLVPSMVYLELHGIGKHALKKQVVDHILDTLPHEDRLLIAKHVKQPDFNIDTASPLEKHIAQYFDFLTINDSCLVLAKSKGVNRFYNIHDWSEMLIRKLNSFHKIWFLKPEQMAFMKS